MEISHALTKFKTIFFPDNIFIFWDSKTKFTIVKEIFLSYYKYFKRKMSVQVKNKSYSTESGKRNFLSGPPDSARRGVCRSGSYLYFSKIEVLFSNFFKNVKLRSWSYFHIVTWRYKLFLAPRTWRTVGECRMSLVRFADTASWLIQSRISSRMVTGLRLSCPDFLPSGGMWLWSVSLLMTNNHFRHVLEGSLADLSVLSHLLCLLLCREGICVPEVLSWDIKSK